jgi:hypothetical protein
MAAVQTSGAGLEPRAALEALQGEQLVAIDAMPDDATADEVLRIIEDVRAEQLAAIMADVPCRINLRGRYGALPPRPQSGPVGSDGFPARR